MLAPLSPNEEATLRRIGLSAQGQFDPQRIQRLLQLGLVEWTGWRWQLTAVGRRRYGNMVRSSIKASKSVA
jgi:hypothetical protein